MIKLLALCAIFMVGDPDFTDTNTVPEITKQVQKNTGDIQDIKNDIENIKERLEPKLSSSSKPTIEDLSTAYDELVSSPGWGQTTVSAGNGCKGSTRTSFSSAPVVSSSGWGQPVLMAGNGCNGSTVTSYSTRPSVSVLETVPVRTVTVPVRSMPVRTVPATVRTVPVRTVVEMPVPVRQVPVRFKPRQTFTPLRRTCGPNGCFIQ